MESAAQSHTGETGTTEEQLRGRALHVPTRTCVGCGETDSPAELLRLVRGPVLPEGHAEVAVDLSGGSGRGAHVHPRAACLQKAAKGGLSRAFKCPVKTTFEDLATQVEASHDRRITGLLMAAWRTRKLALGADAALDAVRAGAPLAIVATDAGSIADDRSLEEPKSEGRIVRWGDKAMLGALTGRGELAIVAVMSESISSEIRLARTRSEACSRLEVR